MVESGDSESIPLSRNESWKLACKIPELEWFSNDDLEVDLLDQLDPFGDREDLPAYLTQPQSKPVGIIRVGGIAPGAESLPEHDEEYEGLLTMLNAGKPRPRLGERCTWEMTTGVCCGSPVVNEDEYCHACQRIIAKRLAAYHKAAIEASRVGWTNKAMVAKDLSGGVYELGRGHTRNGVYSWTSK